MKQSFPAEVEAILDSIVKEYNKVFSKVSRRAREDTTRSYGGRIRSTTGRFGETVAKKLVEAAWLALNKNKDDLNFPKGRYKLPIVGAYVDSIRNADVQQHIQENIEEYIYAIGQDVHVFEKDQFVLSIESKMYAENAMLKRIMVDSWFLRKIFPNLKFALIQFESQLGGDYSSVATAAHYGSKPTHTIMSHFDVELEIITLLEGERKVDRPIHKAEFYKPLEKQNLRKAVNQLMRLLR